MVAYSNFIKFLITLSTANSRLTSHDWESYLYLTHLSVNQFPVLHVSITVGFTINSSNFLLSCLSDTFKTKEEQFGCHELIFHRLFLIQVALRCRSLRLWQLFPETNHFDYVLPNLTWLVSNIFVLNPA